MNQSREEKNDPPSPSLKLVVRTNRPGNVYSYIMSKMLAPVLASSIGKVMF